MIATIINGTNSINGTNGTTTKKAPARTKSARTKSTTRSNTSPPLLHLDLPRRIPLNLGSPRKANITLVGCGGTGSFLALHLARLAHDALGQRRLDELRLTFVDPDQVEPKNIGRQNFIPAEVGRFKAETLARRYSLGFGLNIRFFNTRFEATSHLDYNMRNRDGWLHLLIGAVDTTTARRDLDAAARQWTARLWWLDCGNDDHSGQVLLGNRTKLAEPEISTIGCTGLPLPSVQRPKLVEVEEDQGQVEAKPQVSAQPPTPDPHPPTPIPQPPSCAEDLLAGYQSLMVNQQVAGFAASYVYRMLILRDLDSYATDFDLQAGNAYSRHILDRPPEVSR